jgi:cytochrome c-type biogenesis protein CcmH/NrfG
MAGNDGERRMVFDIRGRRKNVVKVVYGILALLMGASLFLVIGPFNIAGLFGASDAVNSAAKQFEEQATTLERKLKQDPEDDQLLLNLTRARINAGNNLAVSNPETGEVGYTA